MSLPTFLIIGAPKAGTTSIHSFLSQHPDVFVPTLKEPRFFTFEGVAIDPRDPVNRNTITRFEDYRALFAGAGAAKAVGEASPGYLASPGAAGRIRARVPAAKMIACLRDPAERAWSHFIFAQQMGFEPPSARFADIFEENEVDLGGFVRRRPYLPAGFYARSLRAYLDVFPREQLKILLFEDLQRDPLAFMREVHAFIGVPEFEPDTTARLAASGIPRSGSLHRLANKPTSWKRWLKGVLPRATRTRMREAVNRRNLTKPRLDSETRRRLIAVYHDDVRQLEEMIGRDLSGWLND